MKRRENLIKISGAIRNFLIFFSLTGFIITCCMTLFLTILSSTLGITFDGENLELAAKLTFLNVLIISVIFTVIDMLRRRLTVKRPIEKIKEAAEKVIAGDFSVRIPKFSSFATDRMFGEITSCFNKMTEELSSVETLRTDFIANVSHEMKTPLALISNYGTLLASENLSEKDRIEYATAISSACRRLSDMMTNILRLTRLENQKIYPKGKEYDLSEQLCESLLLYESTWENKNIDIEADIEEGVRIVADAELVSLVWNNLLSNAFKFTEEGGRVSLRLRADENYATVTVSDTGCGISPEVGEHIFEKFYQADTSRATQGNGLGLALVKRIVDIVGGEISVASELGSGTTFSVKIGRK